MKYLTTDPPTAPPCKLAGRGGLRQQDGVGHKFKLTDLYRF